MGVSFTSCGELAASFQEGARSGSEYMNAVFANAQRNTPPIAAPAASPLVYAPPTTAVSPMNAVRTHAYDLNCIAMHNYINLLHQGIAPKGDLAHAAWQEYLRLYEAFQQLKQQKNALSLNPGVPLQQRSILNNQMTYQLRKMADAGKQFKDASLRGLYVICSDDEAYSIYKQYSFTNCFWYLY